MQPDARDAALLWDMLEAARSVQLYTAGISEISYLRDRKLQLAIERLVEIIGEAARGVSPAFKSRHPNWPWRGMIAQRNVLAHDYGDIKQERLWRVATEYIPELVTLLEPFVGNVDSLIHILSRLCNRTQPTGIIVEKPCGLFRGYFHAERLLFRRRFRDHETLPLTNPLSTRLFRPVPGP